MPNEDEILFMAYSVFTVTRITQVPATGLQTAYTVIGLDAGVDNQHHQDSLPLATWS